METTSPYETPKAEILNEQDEYGPIKILSAKGRIGRLRYIAYTIGITLLFYTVMMAFVGLIAATTSENSLSAMMAPIMVVGFGAMFFINILLTIQRCHDFNVTGWLSLILLVPFAPLIFWFLPGTEGANKFGPPPPPNKGVALILVIVFVLVVVLGILAAIAIPAYQDYLTRAAGAGM
jgi:uncharacterized membrane protein YhaH (DUF805 family)